MSISFDPQSQSAAATEVRQRAKATEAAQDPADVAAQYRLQANRGLVADIMAKIEDDVEALRDAREPAEAEPVVPKLAARMMAVEQLLAQAQADHAQSGDNAEVTGVPQNRWTREAPPSSSSSQPTTTSDVSSQSSQGPSSALNWKQRLLVDETFVANQKVDIEQTVADSTELHTDPSQTLTPQQQAVLNELSKQGVPEDLIEVVKEGMQQANQSQADPGPTDAEGQSLASVQRYLENMRKDGARAEELRRAELQLTELETLVSGNARAELTTDDLARVQTLIDALQQH